MGLEIVNQGSFETLEPLPADPGAKVCEFSSAEITVTRFDIDAEVEIELVGAGGGERIVMVARGGLVLSGRDTETEPLGPGDWAVLGGEATITAVAGQSGASLVVTRPR